MMYVSFVIPIEEALHDTEQVISLQMYLRDKQTTKVPTCLVLKIQLLL